jgi:uncharacterized protein (TIGR00288 family)
MKLSRMPIPSLRRMMVFVDGENLVQRYQDMVSKGRKPRLHLPYLPDIYVWHPDTVEPGLHHVIRAIYYTYAFGSEDRITEIKEEIKKLFYTQFHDQNNQDVSNMLDSDIYPCVFRKYKNKKAKGVDIQMTVDILTNVHMNNLDTVYLVSGDGDYKPVIQEAIRHGKNVYLAALSSGLNKELIYVVDKFIDLDKCYFEREEND